MFGLEAIANQLRQALGIDIIPALEPRHECTAGDPRCWGAVVDQRHVVRAYEGLATPRLPSSVTGIMVHQLGCQLGVSKRQLQAAAGDPRLALQHRVLRLPYHVVGLLCGDVIRNHPVTRYTYHGNGGNRFTVGVGIEGLYPGRETTRTAKHTDLHRAVMVGRAALAEAERMLRESGITGLITVHAHRNFAAKRAADPGDGIWREVVGWGIEHLSLVPDLDLRMGTGQPIPVEWDAASRYTWAGKLRAGHR